jgi:TfoX N-terminal domain
MRWTPNMPERVAGRVAPGMPTTAFAAARLPVYTIVAMAYDEELAGRIRQLIGSDTELTEKKMFGGLAFLIQGNMAIAASSGGGAMVRVDPAQSDVLVATTNARYEHARPGHARMVAGQFRRSTHRRPASPLDRDRHRIGALAAAQVEAALIILMRRCVVSYQAA